MATLVTYKASEVDVLRCQLSAIQSKTTLIISDTLISPNNTHTPKPFLTTSEGNIFSSLSICEYFFSNSEFKSTSGANLKSFLSWIVYEVDTILSSTNKPKILGVLDEIEEAFNSSKDISIPQDTSKPLNMIDIFLYSTLARARFGQSLSSWPNISKYMSQINQHPTVLNTQKTFGTKSITHSSLPFTWSSKPIKPATRKTFYLTTAIIYTNGPPHIGHGYEYVFSDVIQRFHRQFDEDVFYLTGSDEHGQKIANNATMQGLTPIEICDKFSGIAKELHRDLNSQYDRYLRTTEPHHKKLCHWLWNKAKENGDIYLSQYEGWYNEREENFLTENDAKAMNYVDPSSGLPLIKMSEESYFFRMSKYQQRLIDYIHANPTFIQPDFRKNEVLGRLQDPLLDLSCSRTNITWGIPVPDDEKHVIYVWFDALSNYLSGIDYPNGNKSYYWDSATHVIGKDISWFHCVIWPCILMSANISLPKTIILHGFISASDGRKMSKSIGNIIDPFELVKNYPSDLLRYYLIKEAPLGADLRFDPDSLIDINNSDLADSLGNLVHRGTALCIKSCGGVVPEENVVDYAETPFDCCELHNRVYTHLENLEMDKTVEDVIYACRSTNKFITDMAPWAIKDPSKQKQVIRTILEALYILAVYFEPVIPIAAQEIFKRLNTPKLTIPDLSIWYDNLKPGTPVTGGDVLFKKIPLRAIDVPLQKFEIRLARVSEIVEVDLSDQNGNSSQAENDVRAENIEGEETKNETPKASKLDTFQTKTKKSTLIKALLFMGEPLIDITLPSLDKLNVSIETLNNKLIPVLCNLKRESQTQNKVEVVIFKGQKGSFTLPFSSSDGAKLNPTGSLVATKSHPPILKYRDLPTRDEFLKLKFGVENGQLTYNSEILKGGWNEESEVPINFNTFNTTQIQNGATSETSKAKLSNKNTYSPTLNF